MIDDYRDIFNKRGSAYHQGMVTYPLARAEEFRQIVALADIEDGHTILDIPSGGCYLNSHINKQVKIVSVESAKQFIRKQQSSENYVVLLCKDVTSTPLHTNSIDRVISLAGLHHIMDKHSFFNEAFRLLKPGGLLCIADVWHDTDAARFLNIFVDQNSSMGHKGQFIDETINHNLESVGFEVLQNRLINYYWKFDTALAMADFCQQLFGIDQASRANIITGIEFYLGYISFDDRCLMNWQLQFMKCKKPKG